jgi:penicillin-binding protein 1A
VIRTTLDPALQRVARDELRELLAGPGARAGVGTGAIVLLDTGGAVRAMVGGPDYRASHFNHATVGKRQPGSAFKPFVFLTALEHGYRRDSIVHDGPVRIGTWQPANYDGRFRGDVSLATAFALSLNTPAVRLVQDLGVGPIVDTAYRLGIASVIRDVPSVALGTSEVTPIELTGAYLPFATGGLQRPVHAVSEVTDQSGRRLHRHRRSEARVITAALAAEMRALFREAVVEGTGKAARIGNRPVAGKTGTTQNSRDAWFVGFSGDYVLGVWLGNGDGTPMRQVTGGGLPARLWGEIMAATPPPRTPEPAIASREPAPAPAPGRSPEERARLPESRGRNIPEELAQRGLDWLFGVVEDALAVARE